MTEAQRATLKAVIESIETRGFPPSHHELSDALGVAPHAIQQRLSRLQRDGHIEITPSGSRAIRVLRDLDGRAVQTRLVPVEP